MEQGFQLLLNFLELPIYTLTPSMGIEGAPTI